MLWHMAKKHRAEDRPLQLKVMISKTEKEALEKAAQVRGTTVSAVVRHCIRISFGMQA